MEFNHMDVEKGECKAIGVAWNNTEAYARFNLKMDADLVRELSAQGYDTVQKYEEYLKDHSYKHLEGTDSRDWKDTQKEAYEKDTGVSLVASETEEPAEVTGPTLEVLRAYLKEKGVKGAHLFGYEKALSTAVEHGYVI